MIRRGELPRRGERLPRGFSEWVFGQVIDPVNLAKLRHEHHRTVILLMALTGMRLSSIATLPRDALQIGSDGHPYLRYLNVKFKREAMMPIPPVLREQLDRQEAWLPRHHPDTQHLLPQRRDATRMIDPQTLHNILDGYVKVAAICHENERSTASDIHPHRFRHHLATSLVNDGVPLLGRQRVLDHKSLDMTATTRASRIDRAVARWTGGWSGSTSAVSALRSPVTRPSRRAAWMKDRISRAKQALPNGYCGLPLVQNCPHPNACLSCDQLPHRPILPGRSTATNSPRPDASRATQSESRLRLVESAAGGRRGSAETHHDGPGHLEADTAPAARRSTRRGRRTERVSAERTHAIRRRLHPIATDATARVRRALRELDRRGGDVKFAAVAATADVTHQFLYTHPELRENIGSCAASDTRPVAAHARPRQRRVDQNSVPRRA